jgi:hypothetical protein
MPSSFVVSLRGYDMRQVDALIAQADEALASGSEAQRTAARDALAAAALEVRPRGYVRGEVDDAVAERLRALG